MRPSGAREAQIREIKSIPRIGSLFHRPYPTNYVLQLVPLRRDLDVYLRRLSGVRRGWATINDADRRLRELCSDAMHEPRLGAPSRKALRAMDCWTEASRNGLNLRCVDHAERFALERFGTQRRFSHWLRRRDPRLIRRFAKLPGNLLGQIRINAYLSHDDVLPCLDEWVQKLASSKNLQDRIERLEVAIRDLPQHEALYPTLIVYLRSSRSIPVIRDALEPILGRFRVRKHAREEYAEVVMPHATVTQGFRLYKRYLRLLGLLDELYDARTNYAYRLAGTS